MEMRVAKLIVNKSGSGSLTFRATLPTNWVREMGLDEESRDLRLEFKENTITIKNNEEDIQMKKSIKIQVGQDEYLELEGVKLRSDSPETSYETRRRNTKIENTEEEYKIKVNRIKEKWDINGNIINVDIIKEYYSNEPVITILSSDVTDLIEYENRSIEEVKQILGGNEMLFIKTLKTLNEKDLLGAVGIDILRNMESYAETIANANEFIEGDTFEEALEAISHSSLCGGNDEKAIEEWVAEEEQEKISEEM